MRVIILLAAGALLVTPPQGAGQARPGIDGLRLGPGDAIRLEMFSERGVIAGDAGSRQGVEYAIDAAGEVLLPVAGVVRVAGRDFGEVRREVEAAFAAEFVGAAIRLTPLLRIAVLGAVRSPGLFPVDPTMSFADLLASAGGLSEEANQGDVRLVRGGRTVVVTSTEDVAALAVTLESGDRLVVGRRSWTSRNLPFLLGAGASILASVLTAVIVR